MYSPTAMDHFLRPRNAGELVASGPGDAVGRGEAVNSSCGDTALLTVRVAGGKVVEARFRSKGCAGAIAACSAATEILGGRTIAEGSAIDAASVARHLDGLPDSKLGCAEMAARAARIAVEAAAAAAP